MYEERTYRDLFKGSNLEFFDVCVKETDLRVGTSKNLYNEAIKSVKKYRKQIEAYIKVYPQFLKSLKPLESQSGASPIIEDMCNASIVAGVGPMAAVAGAVSEKVGIELLAYSDEVIVENGGDIFIKTNIMRKVGIFAGKSPLSGNLALEVVPDKTPLGICTSSGTVGHSMSFGKADAVVIVSDSACFADAVATSVCNMVKSVTDIEKSMEFASNIPQVQGVVIIVDDRVAAWGDIKLLAL